MLGKLSLPLPLSVFHPGLEKKRTRKLTLGKMNCSTGLYHTPFTRVPVLMALKRAVTTASCGGRATGFLVVGV